MSVVGVSEVGVSEVMCLRWVCLRWVCLRWVFQCRRRKEECSSLSSQLYLV